MTESELPPDLQAQGPHHGSAALWSMAILKGSQKDLAWEYIRFLASKKCFEHGSFWNTPVRVSTLNSDEYVQNNPAAQMEASRTLC